MVPAEDETLTGRVLGRPATDEQRHGLTLRSDCLLSKWGFNDGDMPEWIEAACDEQGIDYADYRRHDVWHEALWTLVNEHLLPALDHPVELVRIHTSHNPVRASTLNGEDVEDLWTSDAVTCLTPESVTVPLDRVLEAIRAVATA